MSCTCIYICICICVCICICFIFVFVLYLCLFYICDLFSDSELPEQELYCPPLTIRVVDCRSTDNPKKKKKKIFKEKEKLFKEKRRIILYIIAQNMRIFSKFVSGWEDGTVQPKLHQILFMIAPFTLITILIHNLWLCHFTFTFHIKSTMLFQHLWLSIFTFSFHFYIDLSVYFHFSSFPDIKFVKSLKLGWFKKYENS